MSDIAWFVYVLHDFGCYVQRATSTSQKISIENDYSLVRSDRVVAFGKFGRLQWKWDGVLTPSRWDEMNCVLVHHRNHWQMREKKLQIIVIIIFGERKTQGKNRHKSHAQQFCTYIVVDMYENGYNDTNESTSIFFSSVGSVRSRTVIASALLWLTPVAFEVKT